MRMIRSIPPFPTLFAAGLMALCLATPAHATREYILPTLFDVARVAPDDVLNIRARPDAGSEIIGTLAPDATGIEVVEESGSWGRIVTGEGTGWVSLRFLDYRIDVWEDGRLPDGFGCYGTEPFWSMAVENGELVHSTPEGETRSPISSILSTGAFRDPTRAIVAQEITLTAAPQLCSDGMSDRVLGMRALAVVGGPTPRLLDGCCWIRR